MVAGAARRRTSPAGGRRAGPPDPRPTYEPAVIAQLAFASKIHSFATTQRRCREAIALAERHGWGTEPVIAPALVTLTSTMVWTGEFAEAERWLQRTVQAVQADTGPDIRLLLHITTGMLRVARPPALQALDEFRAAERLQSRLAGPHALASQVTGWLLATQPRLGMPGGPAPRSERSMTSGPYRVRSPMPGR